MYCLHTRIKNKSKSLDFLTGAGLDRPLITATHAMFVENKGHRAAAAVVGIQFQHSSIASHFINITSAVCVINYNSTIMANSYKII